MGGLRGGWGGSPSPAAPPASRGLGRHRRPRGDALGPPTSHHRPGARCPWTDGGLRRADRRARRALTASLCPVSRPGHSLLVGACGGRGCVPGCPEPGAQKVMEEPTGCWKGFWGAGVGQKLPPS